MTAHDTIAVIHKAGLTLYLADDGSPRIQGPRENLTPEILAALREHRAALVAHLGPCRRIVTLAGDRDSDATGVLWEGGTGGESARLRSFAEAHRGQYVAMEHRGPLGWRRYLWILCPKGEGRDEPAEAASAVA